MTFEKGQVVYDELGCALSYQAPVGEQHAVRHMYEDYEGEQYPAGDVRVVAKVWEKAPTALYDQRIRELQAKTQEARDKLQEMEAELRAYPARLARLAKTSPVLDRIEAVLERRITHVVVLQQYGGVIVGPFDVLAETWRGRVEGLKLVTLWGDSNGDLSWRVSSYSDGSGNLIGEVIPCTSWEDAQAKAVAAIRKGLADPSVAAHAYQAGRWIESADEFGVSVPEVLRDMVRAQRVKDAQHQVDRARKTLESAEAKLREADDV